MRFLIFTLTLAGFMGCSHPATTPPRPSSDPASPRAAESPLTPLPDTLRVSAVNWEDVKVPEEGSSMKGMDMMDMGQDMKTGDEMDMGGMKGMKMDEPKKPGEGAPQRESPEKKAIQYTCVMHPEVLSDRPGKCPKCGMKLVPKTKPEGQRKGDH